MWYVSNMTKSAIMILIATLAPMYNVPPKVALAVCAVESSCNPKAIGALGEVGLFQVMPYIYKHMGYTRKQMLNPKTNIIVGLEMLRAARSGCIHKRNNDWLVCYNSGIAGGKKFKHPGKSKYVKMVEKHIRKVSTCPQIKHADDSYLIYLLTSVA